MLFRLLIITAFAATAAFAQVPAVEPGVSHELALWRAAHYSDVRYKLNLTLEKMSPVLKGTIEIRVNVSVPGAVATGAVKSEPGAIATGFFAPIILDWRRIRGSETLSAISNVSINGRTLSTTPSAEAASTPPNQGGEFLRYRESNEHLIFRDGVVAGENVIKLDFTSPILTSGSAITRYVDKEDGAEYIYSLFVPSDASTAFPVFDQPDLKARFTLTTRTPDWNVVSNGKAVFDRQADLFYKLNVPQNGVTEWRPRTHVFEETKPISTYVFAFSAGPWAQVSVPGAVATGVLTSATNAPVATAQGTDKNATGDPTTSVYVRKSQAEKFKPHAAEVFRLTRVGIKYLETYFDYKFPFPKYDFVLIPEFPFGGMEHAWATFLREASVIFPTEPTRNDQISRANLIFHETAHQWFGDTVTMKWFDDLWLKEGFAEFMAYKTLEKVMPEANAWKVFYERNKQAAYLTDSTKGTTPIYQEIANLNAAKSAYGNIVYRKAPSFLRQAEFYLGEDKFQTAVRAFLKKHEFANAGWEDLVKEFELAPGADMTVPKKLDSWAQGWVKEPGLLTVRTFTGVTTPIIQGGLPSSKDRQDVQYRPSRSIPDLHPGMDVSLKFKLYVIFENRTNEIRTSEISRSTSIFTEFIRSKSKIRFAFPNYQDYGYGIFLLDDKSRDYVLKNIQNEKDDFLRTMMWGSLWDSVREAELDPKDYVELVIKNLNSPPCLGGVPEGRGGSSEKSFAAPPCANDSAKRGSDSRTTTPSAEAASTPPNQGGEQDEGTIQTLLSRVSTVMNYYLNDLQRTELAPKVEAVLIDRMQNARTLGQRITYYRAFLNIASTENARTVLKEMLSVPASQRPPQPMRAGSPRSDALPLKTKDKFDIVTRLLILGDPDAPALLSELEKTESSDDAKRYAYAAKAGAATAENKAKFWSDFTTNKDISESWIEAAFGPFNSVRHSNVTLPYLEKALAELPNLKRNRKIFFVNGWLGAFIGGQRSEAALAIINKFLADNPTLDKDLRLKILENVDLIERAVKIRTKFRT